MQRTPLPPPVLVGMEELHTRLPNAEYLGFAKQVWPDSVGAERMPKMLRIHIAAGRPGALGGG